MTLWASWEWHGQESLRTEKVGGLWWRATSCSGRTQPRIESCVCVLVGVFVVGFGGGGRGLLLGCCVFQGCRSSACIRIAAQYIRTRGCVEHGDVLFGYFSSTLELFCYVCAHFDFPQSENDFVMENSEIVFCQIFLASLLFY